MKSAVRFCISVFFILCLGLATSCAYYNEKSPGDPSTITTQTPVAWQRISNEVFMPRCAVCHGQGGAGVNVSDYNLVLSQISRIQREINRQSMPPDSPLTAYESALFSNWIAQGTPYQTQGGH